MKSLTAITNKQLSLIIEKAFEEFKMFEFEEGECLNLAVGLHKGLSHFGIKSEVLSVMRTETEVEYEEDEDLDDDNYTEKMSHAVLFYDEKQRSDLLDYDKEKLTFDINGIDAFKRWSNDWNQVQMELREPEEDFWIESIEGSLEDFCQQAQEQYGSIHERKLVNDKSLQNNIADFVTSEINNILNQKLIRSNQENSFSI